MRVNGTRVNVYKGLAHQSEPKEPKDPDHVGYVSTLSNSFNVHFAEICLPTRIVDFFEPVNAVKIPFISIGVQVKHDEFHAHLCLIINRVLLTFLSCFTITVGLYNFRLSESP